MPDRSFGVRRVDKTAGQRPFSVGADWLNSAMSSRPVEHQHPVVDFAQRLHSRLDSLADVPLTSMAQLEKREVLLELTQSAAQLEMLRLRLLVETEQSEATVDSGARSAADWLAIESRHLAGPSVFAAEEP